MKIAVDRLIVQPRALASWRGARFFGVGLAACPAFAASVLISPGVPGLCGGALALVMTAIAAADWRRFRIPDELTALALLIGCAAVAFAAPDDRLAAMLAAASRALGAAVAIFAFRWGYERLRGREGIGLGDVKLAGVAGLWLSWSGFSIAIEIAAISALCVFAARQRVKARAFRANAKIPFGAFLAPAIWLCWALETLDYIG